MDKGGIDYLSFGRVLKRGTAETIKEQDDALLLRDRISGGYLFACEDAEVGIELLDDHLPKDCELLMTSNQELGKAACKRFGFSGHMECYQFAYYGEKPTVSSGLVFRTAEKSDLPMLLENYQLLSAEELEAVVQRGSVLLGYDGAQLVGFMGEHLEGAMGILYILPEYRRRGHGTALQKMIMARTMEEGDIPFGHVAVDNHSSIQMQKEIGMTQSDTVYMWMWK